MYVMKMRISWARNSEVISVFCTSDIELRVRGIRHVIHKRNILLRVGWHYFEIKGWIICISAGKYKG